MYLIALFGAVMMLISAWIILSPESWADSIVRFSNWPPFHLFEVLSRLGFGIAFLLNAEQTLHPRLMTAFGYVLTAVAIGLVLTPPSQHRRFAKWSAHTFRRVFRPTAIASFLFGALILYSALGGGISA